MKFRGFDQAVVFDVETTGFSSQNDRIISICLAKADFGVLKSSSDYDLELEIINEVFDPGRKIPTQVSRIHGISDRDVAGKPDFGKIAGKIRDFIGSCPLIAHNVSFDRQFLDAEFQRAGLDWPGRNRLYCTMQRYRQFNGGKWSGSKLEDVTRVFGLPLRATQVHHAEEDTMMAFRIARIFYMMDNNIPIPGGTPKPPK